MKFQKKPSNKLKKRYKDYYVKYSKLINILKTNSKDEFIIQLNENINRICKFINQEIKDIENNSNKMNITNKLQKEFLQFPTFIRMNIMGLKKLIKKCEKKYKIELMDVYKEIFEKLIKSTKKADQIKLNYTKSLKTNEKVFDFWISKDKFISFLMELTQHVKDENGKIDELRITSIYYDDIYLNGYRDCLKENENCETFRLFWEGDGIPSEIKIERTCGRLNKHIDGLIISEKNIIEFLNGKDIFYKILGFKRGDHYELLNKNNYNEVGIFENSLCINTKEKLEIKNNSNELINNKFNSSNKNISEEIYTIYKEIQNSLINKNVRPIVRTVYKTHIFKSENLTINLDSEIAMVKECADYELSTDPRPLTRWCRSDIPNTWPWNNVKDVRYFPYLTLRINSITELPSWLLTIINQSILETVPNFSKNFHACSLFFPIFNISPYWMLKIHEELSSDNLSINSTTVIPEQPIVIPVRVEPKVFFANERTFLSWVQFSIFLGGVGTAMLGFGTDISAIFGLLLVFVSCLFALYSLYLFHSRAKRIRNKDSGPYDDLYGPTIVVGIFLLVLILAICFKFPLKRNKKIF